nr:ABC transporter permease [Martelella alba]
MLKSTLDVFYLGLRAAILVLLVWQMAVFFLAPPPYILPPPLAVTDKLFSAHQTLFAAALITLREILAGFVAGVGFGAATALMVVAWPRFGRLVWPVFVVLQSFPVFVIAPMLVLWFGFGLSSKVVMTAIIVFFPVASSFADGLMRTDLNVIRAARLDGAEGFSLLFFIRLPLAVPALFSGLRIAAPLAPLGAVVGEWVGAAGGLGFVMVQANARMQTDMVFAAMLILAAEAVMFRKAVDLAAPLFTRWAATA